MDKAHYKSCFAAFQLILTKMLRPFGLAHSLENRSGLREKQDDFLLLKL